MTNIFSEEVPELLKEHFEHLKGSAISVEVMEERGYISIMGHQKLEDLSFSKAQYRKVGGILIPLHGVDGTVVGHQYRPDKPRLNAKERPIKYENPAGSSVRFDVPPRCLPQLGNPQIPLWFTEGVKKADALATVGTCVVGLTGVWGFKGKNPLGGTTVLADFDRIALKDRVVYLVFDSDASTNLMVAQALERLKEHLTRKGASVRIIKLPPGKDGAKTGADDYLAQGHNLQDLIGLEVIDDPNRKERKRTEDQYIIEANRFCFLKKTQQGEIVVPLCNFQAQIIEDVLRDDGQQTARVFKILGQLGDGRKLPEIDVPANNFNSLNWVTSEWGNKAVVAAGSNAKDRLREYIQFNSYTATEKTVYTHAGWREVNGEMTFLTAGGALGMPQIEVELDSALSKYSLPEPAGDPLEAIKASFDFLLTVGQGERGMRVTLPLWAAMYLAPLSEILEPAFTIWIVGPSGSFKSVISALALCHFGNFDELHLPASWRDTGNKLEKLLFLAKDIPLVIDDWAPGQNTSKAQEMEVKAEYIIRAQGNRQGKGRMWVDTSSRPTYSPRGILITSGEQLPAGHSNTARIYSLEIDHGDINVPNMTEAQKNKGLYRVAMAHYIQWLKPQYPALQKELKVKFEEYRDRAQAKDQHARLPAAIAWLCIGLEMGVKFAAYSKAISEAEAASTLDMGQEIICSLAAEQGARVEEERPGKRAIKILRAMLDSGKARLDDKDQEAPTTPPPGVYPIGWKDGTESILLNPGATYAAIHEYSGRGGEPFTFKEKAMWQDIQRLGYVADSDEARYTTVVKIFGIPKRVIKMKRSALDAQLL